MEVTDRHTELFHFMLQVIEKSKDKTIPIPFNLEQARAMAIHRNFMSMRHTPVSKQEFEELWRKALGWKS